MNTTTDLLRQYAAGSDPVLAASARRELAKRASLPVDDLMKVSRMRELAAGNDPGLAGAAMAWLVKRRLAISSESASPKAVRLTQQIVELVAKSKRDGWTKARRQAEINKLLDQNFTPTRRKTR